MKYILTRLPKSIFRLAITFFIIIGISFIPSIFQYDGKFHNEPSFTNYYQNVTTYVGNMLEGDLGHWGTRNRPISHLTSFIITKRLWKPLCQGYC